MFVSFLFEEKKIIQSVKRVMARVVWGYVGCVGFMKGLARVQSLGNTG